ncbi:unnamed protein product, partial [Mesorhabditis spiculigera]
MLTNLPEMGGYGALVHPAYMEEYFTYLMTSRLLLRIAPYKCFVAVSVLVLYQFFVDNSIYSQTFYTYVMFLIYHVEHVILIWIYIFGDPELKVQFYSMLNFGVPTNESLRSANGQRLAFDNNQETEIYFTQLKNSW